MQKNIERKFTRSLLSVFIMIMMFAVPITKTHAMLEEIYEWELMTLEEVEEYAQQLSHKERSNDLTHLTLAKKAILAGDTNLALRYLERISKKGAALSDIRNRYESMIHFIKNDTEKSLSLLSNLDIYNSKSYREVCTLKIYAMMAESRREQKVKSEAMALKNQRDLRNEFARCRDYTALYTPNDHLWFNNLELMQFGRLAELRGSYVNDIGYILSDNEILRIWLKTALYLGRHDLILNNIKDFPLFVYQDKTARELLAFIFYRIGDVTKAQAFIEDIVTPNSESIRGNIRLSNEEYELAYGHFKLALKEKENSANALERAIPLAWMLGVWSDGPELLTRLVGPEHDFKKRKTLDIAFKIRLDEIERAYEEILALTKDYKDYPPQEVDLLRSYLALRMKDQKHLAEATERLCRRNEGLNCWTQMQSLIWENTAQTIDREDRISLPKDWDIESLKQARNYAPLTEQVIIDQRDIEELDGESVQIKPE
jgi:hypothetical protein